MRPEKESSIAGIIKSLGLVFGAIGTSPIYTLTVIILLTKPTEANVIGILSLIVWTLAILVTVAYACLTMSLGRKGEGGTIVLRELLVPLLNSARKTAFVTLLTFIGISLLVGDGVITPAISILSAVEGILLIPGLDATRQEVLIVIACVIAILLFSFQKRGGRKSFTGIWSFNASVVFVFGGLRTCFNSSVPIYSQSHKSVLCDTVSRRK